MNLNERNYRVYNKITLIGNLGADPEIKQTGAGSNYAILSLATNRVVKARKIPNGTKLLFGMIRLQTYFLNIVKKVVGFYWRED